MLIIIVTFCETKWSKTVTSLYARTPASHYIDWFTWKILLIHIWLAIWICKEFPSNLTEFSLQRTRQPQKYFESFELTNSNPNIKYCRILHKTNSEMNSFLCNPLSWFVHSINFWKIKIYSKNVDKKPSKFSCKNEIFKQLFIFFFINISTPFFKTFDNMLQIGAHQIDDSILVSFADVFLNLRIEKNRILNS